MASWLAEGTQALQATKSSGTKARDPGPYPGSTALLTLAVLQEQVTSNLFVPQFPCLQIGKGAVHIPSIAKTTVRLDGCVIETANTAEKGRVLIACHGEVKPLPWAEPWECLPQKRGPLFFGVTYI